MIRRFARPYARAIMDAAGTPQKANELRGELMTFANALRGSEDLRALYANPGIDEASKLTITAQLARKMKASDLGAKTLEVLVRHNSALGVAVAKVRSAKSLNPDEIRDLADTLSKRVGKSVELDIRTDPSLLGGFVVQIGSEIWDASVAGKINKFRESLA